MIQKFINYLLKNQIIFALFILALGWFIIQIRDIFVSVFLSYIITSALLPFVTFLRNRGVPRVLSALIPYGLVLFSIFLLVIPLIPFVYSQIGLLATGFPHYLQQATGSVGFKIEEKQVESYLTNDLSALGQNAFTVTSKVFGGFFAVITVFIVSFYLLFYHDRFKSSFAAVFQPHSRPLVLKTLDRINEKLGAWLRGQIILSFFIGLLCWIGLLILQIPYALPLALLAGILEIVPTLGPILSAVPAVIVAFTVSPTKAITVILLYLGVQMLEGHLIVPKVMQKAVGLNPVIIILAVLIGANLMGIAGALLAIPFLSFIVVVFNSIGTNKGEATSRPQE